MRQPTAPPATWALALFTGLFLLLLPSPAAACGSCFGPIDKSHHVRQAKRMQPDAFNASYGPTRGPLEWGQLNFLHTTDTHGWLEGHLTEPNYGADWGDFVSFAIHMKQRAKYLGVDLLLVDTGDLHDGAGLSDATDVDGSASNAVFARMRGYYDLLTIGNHELYYADIAYQAYSNFSKVWGDRYLTSNVEILDTATQEYVPLGHRYKYLTTDQGLRILAFGVLFDFKGNTNVTRVTPAATMVTEAWFQDLVQSPPGPVDLFLLIGHNTVLQQPDSGTGTFGLVHAAIRAVYPDTPVQIFGGHSHIRDFQVYDSASTALESGRYCETLGWLAMSGFNTTSNSTSANAAYADVPHPTRAAVTTNTTSTSSTVPWTYARRYLDWNRRTFEYHALGSQTTRTFDTTKGRKTTAQIYDLRQQLNLTAQLGCSPQLWCQACAPFNSSGSIYSLLTEALGTVVVNASRADRARVSIVNTGSVRFDLHKGPFLRDDAYIVSPFEDVFLYIADVPYEVAAGALDYLNDNAAVSKRSTTSLTAAIPEQLAETCLDPFTGTHPAPLRRQATTLSDGYLTTDAFGTDGDDTAHAALASYDYPDFFQALGGFPASGDLPDVVDLVFIDYIESDILDYLNTAAGAEAYSEDDVTYYVDETFSTQTYLPLFVESSEVFQQNLDNCTIY